MVQAHGLVQLDKSCGRHDFVLDELDYPLVGDAEPSNGGVGLSDTSLSSLPIAIASSRC